VAPSTHEHLRNVALTDLTMASDVEALCASSTNVYHNTTYEHYEYNDVLHFRYDNGTEINNKRHV